MTKNFSYFLAKRYLVPKGLFLIFINVLTILGICLGVAVMIVVLSVMKGFENEFQRTLLGFDPHLMLLDPEMTQSSADGKTFHEVGAGLKVVPGIVSQSPFVAGHVMIQLGDRVQNPIMKAILPDDPQLESLREQGMVVAGELDLEPRVDESGEFYERVIVSKSLADSFHKPDGTVLQIGDVITVLSPIMMERAMRDIREHLDKPKEDRGDSESFLENMEEAMAPTELMVVAVVDSPMYQQFILPPLNVGQDLFGLEDEVHGLAIFTEDPYLVEETKARIEGSGLLPYGWSSMSWVDQNKPRLEAIRTERSLMSVILFIIVIVATFCVSVTIIVTTVQKRREIGVMKAIGAQTGQIVRVFVHQGQVVGLCGVLSGVALGLIVLFQLENIRSIIGKFGADPFPQHVYGLSKLPVEIIPSSILGIAIGAIIACTIAAIPPAWAVARLDPAKALRAD
ncbi:FtsX-like permease family protein [Verrucomicrobiales bacterium]|jgi:lipoprotein-releasing system permease protein|nr:FtsX-like permease family protein [Verrucomicrobiales bacterium]MDB4589662.1 FtsX-like permease family protein [Verrucomicrobiales bacterium]MDC0502808.1 FtsX-like permease family protein [Verrucomicrobiales bacterium]MDF1787199.1 FtsX-like permease family protein [Verrucomicrobiales bacterium]